MLICPTSLSGSLSAALAAVLATHGPDASPCETKPIKAGAHLDAAADGNAATYSIDMLRQASMA